MSRVAGMTCLQVFNGHCSAVSGMALVQRPANAYLVSDRMHAVHIKAIHV